jgi:hypothetical protein
MLKEIDIEFKLIPMGDNPKNKPTRPSNPKLKTIERTKVSIRSMQFLPLKRTLTRQYPGRKVTKTKAKTYRKNANHESPGTK